MRHRTEKYKEKTTRKSSNKERIIDVKGNILDYGNIKDQQHKLRESSASASRLLEKKPRFLA